MIDFDLLYGALQEYEKCKEEAIGLSSEIKRLAKESIDSGEERDGLNELFRKAGTLIKERPFTADFFRDSFERYCEAKIFISFLREGKIGMVDGVDADIHMRAYLSVLRDMRKRFLELIEKADVDGAKRLFSAMNELFGVMEKLNAKSLGEIEPMIDRSREELALYDFKRRKEELNLDDVWFKR
jgi:predicted translin family RNA/ssDNA-binding protein